MPVEVLNFLMSFGVYISIIIAFSVLVEQKIISNFVFVCVSRGVSKASESDNVSEVADRRIKMFSVQRCTVHSNFAILPSTDSITSKFAWL